MKSNLKNIQIQTNPLPMKSWKTSNQVLCFQSCLTIFIVSFTVIISSQLMDYTYIYLKEISQEIFEQETRHQVKMNSLGQHRQTIQYFQQGKQSLSCINDLYQMLQRFHISSHPATDCLFPEQNSLGETIDQFCYAVPVPIKENITDERNFRELNSLLNAYQAILELSKLTFCTFRGESQIFFAHSLTMAPTYRPHTRPWYTNHVKAVESLNDTNQTILISSPYITFKTSVIQITQTMSLLQLNGYFDGTVAVDSKVPELPPRALEQAQPIIVNENGDLLTTKINGVAATQIFKFYQTNYTGFTEEDWELLKSSSNEDEFVIIDLFNAIKNINIIISAIKLKDYYLFMQQILLNFRFIDDNYFTSQIQDIFKNIEQFYSAQYVLIALISVCFSVLAIVFQIIIIKYVFLQDFNQLSQVAEKEIFKNQIQQTLRIRTNSVEIRQLFKSYYQAVDKMTSNSTNTKNNTCKIIEKIEYPKPFRFLRLDKRLLENLQDNQIENYECSPYLGLVIQCFKKLFDIKIYKFLR